MDALFEVGILLDEQLANRSWSAAQRLWSCRTLTEGPHRRFYTVVSQAMPTQLTLAPGARVVVRDEEWIVRSIKAEASGGQAVRVSGVSELVRGRDAIFLTALDDIQALRPEETELVADTSSRYANTRLYLESLARRTPTTDAAIHLGHRAAITPADYQLRPTARALGLLRPRFLMADGVGLGKTIEVGVMLTELIRRGRGRRILVVAMKSILGQFQEELWGRFTIPLVRLDSVGIQRVQAKVPSSANPFHYFDRVIISIDTLKNDVKYRKHLEDCRWDVIVIDECQNVAMRTRGGRGQGAQRAQLAKVLAKQCDALILTSATPHDGSPESFASLVRLLEPTAIADVEDFTKEEVEGFFQRKFKKDIAHELAEVFPEREMHPHRFAASKEEDAFIDRLHQAKFATIDGHRGSGGVLFRTTLFKAFLSSPLACISTIDKRLAHKQLDVESLEGVDRAAAEADRAVLLELRSLAEAVDGRRYPKYAKLLERVKAILASDEQKSRVVIFSERIQTLEFLRDSLVRDAKLKWTEHGTKNQIETFHGTLDDQRQMALVKSFGSEDSSIRVLLASDAAAEGINLHYFCNHLVHYDLPWSLITLVQRNGRIDRFGQKKTPHIDYLLTVPSNPDVRGDLRVLDRLIEKEEQVQKNLGDAAWLMGLHDAELEEQEIAKAVQGEKAAEDVIPDAPKHAEGDDWFNEIFGGGAAHEEPVDKRGRDSLFASDLDFAREAFEVAVDNAGESVVWKDAQKGFDLVPPEDLERRYDYLPPELRRDRPRFRLTIDTERVMQSIDIARQKEKEWPEWELFWPLHPVCEWLDDRVLSALGRHEAWVVRVPGGLEGDDAHFLFQGVYSNGRSQNVLVDWFAVPFRGSRVGDVITRSECLRRSGLLEVKGNPGATSVPPALNALRHPAVEQAQRHMTNLRKERAEAIGEPLRAGIRELMAWRAKSLQRIANERTLASKGGNAIPTPTRRRLDAEQKEIDAVYEERKRWIEQGLRTVHEPYLRLAAVFIRADLA